MQRKNSGKDVLVLSDSKNFRLFSSRALIVGGYRVKLARDAKEAASIVREVERSGGVFDLVVTGMEGASMGFYAGLSDLSEENVYIPTLPIYSRVMEPFNRDDKENELPEEIWGRSVGDNFIGQISAVIG